MFLHHYRLFCIVYIGAENADMFRPGAVYLSRKMKLLCLFLEKSSKDLQRNERKAISSLMVLSSLSETEEADAFPGSLGNLEVPSHVRVVQVVVVVSTINFRPRGPVV